MSPMSPTALRRQCALPACTGGAESGRNTEKGGGTLGITAEEPVACVGQSSTEIDAATGSCSNPHAQMCVPTSGHARNSAEVEERRNRGIRTGRACARNRHIDRSENRVLQQFRGSGTCPSVRGTLRTTANGAGGTIRAAEARGKRSAAHRQCRHAGTRVSTGSKWSASYRCCVIDIHMAIALGGSGTRCAGPEGCRTSRRLKKRGPRECEVVGRCAKASGGIAAAQGRDPGRSDAIDMATRRGQCR